MKFHTLFFLFLALSAGTVRAQVVSSANDQIQKLASEKQWVDLLHIRRNILGFKRSQVVGKDFFLALGGRIDPAAELIATLKALMLPPDAFKPDTHPLCRFPGRKRWLQARLGLPEESFPKVACPLFESYKRRLGARFLSIVFSSYYSASPGSAFGHTLFRISKNPSDLASHNELLDYGIGFAADSPPNVNPVWYGVGGLLGGFNGSFTNIPYYYKVREYSAAEARDLWSYELDLTQNEVDFVIDHLWEIGINDFGYYFFTQNCGLHILTVLEAAVPRLHLVDRVPLWVIPADVVRALAEEPGLVKKVTFRPSLKTKIDFLFARLSPSDQSRFLGWVKTQNLDLVRQSAGLMDLAIDFFDYKNPELIQHPDPVLMAQRQNLLVTRAGLRERTEEIPIPYSEDQRPDQGHKSGRAEIALGANSRLGEYTDFDLRFALHDLLDPSRGYPMGAKIEFMNFAARYYTRDRRLSDREALQFRGFDLFLLEALPPRTTFDKPLSWKARLGTHRVSDFSCEDCLAYGLDFGIGATWRIRESGLSYVSAMLEGDVLGSEGFDQRYVRATLGPSLTFRFSLAENLGLLAGVGEKTMMDRDFRSKLVAFSEIRTHITSLFSTGIRFEHARYNQRDENDARASLYYFF